MRVHYVEAEPLGVAPLLTAGPMADLHYKFVLIEDELVYGNLRNHWDLVIWLLRGPLSSRYPIDLVRARPIVEARCVLTVFGGVSYRGEIETIVHVAPKSMTGRAIQLLVARALQEKVLTDAVV